MDIQIKINEYVSALKFGNRSENTIRTYRKDLLKFVDFFSLAEVEDLHNLSGSDYLRFYESVIKSKTNPNGLSSTSLNGLIRSINAFMSYLGEEFSNNAFFTVKLGAGRYATETHVRRLVLTDEEIEAMIGVAQNLQERLMIKLMSKTAIRRGAIVNIKMTDIEGCRIKIVNKGGDETYVYLNNTLCNMLNEYISKERNTKSEYLFYPTRGESETGKLTENSVRNRIHRCALKSGIDPVRANKITPHTLRRTTLTRIAVESGAHAAKQVARHKSITTTMRYIHDDDKVAEQIMMKEG
jgi:site-specific recombinase XerD